MCKVLKISRTVYYYKHKKVVADTKLENSVIEILKKKPKQLWYKKNQS